MQTSSLQTLPSLKSDTPHRILVVEDNEAVSSTLVEILQMAGYEVDACLDGLQAKQYIATQPAPGAALLDITLPFVNGLDLLRMMRKTPTWDHTPVIMLTGMEVEKGVSRALIGGANEYLMKPFEANDLLVRLAEFFAPPLTSIKPYLVWEISLATAATDPASGRWDKAPIRSSRTCSRWASKRGASTPI